jgi:hypothetical protein
MSTSYAPQHARALVMVGDKGSPVTFTKVTTPQDDTTGAPGTPVTTTVAGVAIRVRGNPDRYRELGLTLSENPTLFFVPSTQGQKPADGSTVVWGGTTYTTKDVLPIDLDGASAIAHRVVVML